MAALQEYKCPNCGGGVSFDSALQRMKCPYCDSTFEMDALQEFEEQVKTEAPDDMQWTAETGGEWSAAETEGMRVYVCKSCGGEIVGDANTAATSCPFCGNPVVMAGQFAGALKPDIVIPFRLDKKAAKAAYEKHIEGKRLLPKVFKEQNHIDEIKGLYVPFWLFDADAEANIRYDATKTRMWTEGSYDCTETSHYSVYRSGSVSFSAVPVDGSSKMPDDLMESIEPFSMQDAVPFNTGYLSGFLADKYDVSAEETIERANTRIKQSTENAFKSTVQGYESVTPKSSSVRVTNGRARYAMFPVWLLNTTWNGKHYTFAMNGQTGRLVGDLPIDEGAYKRWLLGITAVGTVAVLAITYLFWLL